MMQRERKLMVVVCCMVGLLILHWAVRSLVIDRASQLKQQIAAKQAEKENLEQIVGLERTLIKHWTRLSRMTLARDSEAARNKMDGLIKRLLDESGLKKYSTRPGTARTEKKRAGLIFAPNTVTTAEGNLETITKFLHSFYQQPYAMQILSFNLQPVSQRRASVLKLTNLKIEAMVLPTEDAPATQPSAEPVDPWRPAESMLDAYAVLWQRKFMEPYEEDKPPLVDVRPTRPGEPPRPGPDEPKDTSRQETKLIGLIQYGGFAEAVLLNTRTKERTVVNEDEPYGEDGFLILALPDAAVVETLDGKRYVYWLGKTLEEREQLNAKKHPEIWVAVKALDRAS